MGMPLLFAILTQNTLFLLTYFVCTHITHNINRRMYITDASGHKLSGQILRMLLYVMNYVLRTQYDVLDIKQIFY